jgi:glycosyltransferase involved in cell wall biosynthesis
MKGRVLLLIENAPVPADRRVWNEARALTEAGYSVSIVCPSWHFPIGYERTDGISIYRFPLPSPGGLIGHLVEYAIALPVLFALSWLVFFREGFDVIHVANPPDILYLIGRVFRRLGKKFVFDQHDVVPEACATRWSGLKARLSYAIALRAERASYRLADVVISTNESGRRLAIERGRVDPDRVFVVRNAVRRADFRGEERPELRRGRRYLVCYAGVIGPEDGLDRLLLAVRHIVVERGRSDVSFVVMGNGEEFERILQLSRQLGIADAIEFTGWLQDDTLIADYMKTADVCVAPDPKNAVNEYCSMNKIVEYMAMAKPVVAFDLREARETAREAGTFVVSNGSDGDPVAMADRILELLDSPQTRERMGALGRRRFTDVLAWEHQQASLLRAYETLLGQGVATPGVGPPAGREPQQLTG